MLLLSTLFTALARKTGDFIQALFGWSVAALFGRLHRSQRAAVTIALVLSLFWPVFVIGIFLPTAATWFISFVPIESHTVRGVLRMVWLALALIAPAIVGVLVRQAVPPASRNSFLSSMVHGYPLALGMALSFLVTLVTVPLVKLSSIARRWDEEHIYLQPRAERYHAVLKHLVVACVGATLSLLGVALVLATGATARSALFVAAGLAVVSAALGAVGWFSLPTSPMKRTRKRLEIEWKLLRERAT